MRGPGRPGHSRSGVFATVLALSAGVLTASAVTAPPVAALTPPVGFTADSLTTYQTNGIVWALAECRARVGGSSGAAAKLGMPPSTLNHRIKALKIDKARFKFR